jgi:hypothetical protein
MRAISAADNASAYPGFVVDFIFFSFRPFFAALYRPCPAAYLCAASAAVRTRATTSTPGQASSMATYDGLVGLEPCAQYAP